MNDFDILIRILHLGYTIEQALAARNALTQLDRVLTPKLDMETLVSVFGTDDDLDMDIIDYALCLYKTFKMQPHEIGIFEHDAAQIAAHAGRTWRDRRN